MWMGSKPLILNCYLIDEIWYITMIDTISTKKKVTKLN